MTEYLFVMALIATAAVFATRREPNRLLWVIAGLLLVVFVGLRHKVGMDWNNYLVMVARVGESTLAEAPAHAEPAYAALLWVSDRMGMGVYGANTVGAIVLIWGVFAFARRTPLPWMALATAFPFLIVVVGMSANRQAIAIGILLWLVSRWEALALRRRVAWTLAAALFHFSAVFFLMFAVLGLRMQPGYKVATAFVLGVATLIFLQASGGAEYYDQLYISGQSEVTYSSGAVMHVMLNGLPGLLLLFSGRFRELLFPSAILKQMAIAAIALIPLALFFSAASGRMTLYLFPVSMYVFGALPTLFRHGVQRASIRTALASALACVLYVWLAYANSSLAHIPYSNALWMLRSELHL